MKLFKYFILSSALFIAISGCKKQLEIFPTDTLTPANAFRTLADAQTGVNEAYLRFTNYSNTVYASALVSDEAKLGKDNAGQGAITYRYQYSSDGTSGGDVTGTFGGAYFAIDQINRVLAALPNVIATPAEESRRSVLKGQLLALRAVAHFNIMQAFCKNYSSSDAKGTALSMIESDLNDAFNLSPAVTATTFTDTVMNQLNINAFRARVALFKGDYDAAITYSTFVINSAIRPLATTATFPSIWTDASVTTETLFRIRTGTSVALGGLFTTTGGAIYIAPSNKLINTYAATDVRKATYIGGVGPDAYYVNKHFSSSRGGRAVDVKISRIAEMYLIRAEAYAKANTPNLAAGTADINLLRSQRITGYTNVTFATTADLLTATLTEKYKELCFEGFRIFDLKRNGLPVQRDLADVTASAWQILPTGNYRFVFPIPEFELLANPNCIQNDGY
jgi:starch-binding outer membrane protein, SusD/RagB family